MIYLRSFDFLSQECEDSFLSRPGPNCYPTKYPFNVFRYRRLPRFEFEPITIFYGTNGSGKTTLLNIIAEKLGLHHRSAYNRTDFFEDYVDMCNMSLSHKFGEQALSKSKILTSDDVFDHLIDVRYINAGVDRQREELFDEYAAIRQDQTSPMGCQFRMSSLDEYDMLKKYLDASKGSSSKYVRARVARSIDGRSNGEEALRFFTGQIEENAVYLLDEPENSLSACNQQKLLKFIEESARFFGCQFIISSHSPFFLAAQGAKIYDLDVTPPSARLWTELPNVRAYFELFESRRGEFDR
ncbi:MAG: AAA family ATPase [Clostridia bacterium]|nr:AAA family ATPase [Clostridia bacterium]